MYNRVRRSPKSREMDQQLIYDWNTHSGPEIPPGRRVMLNDETLRDGLQNPSVRDPSIAEKIEILHCGDYLLAL